MRTVLGILDKCGDIAGDSFEGIHHDQVMKYSQHLHQTWRVKRLECKTVEMQTTYPLVISLRYYVEVQIISSTFNSNISVYLWKNVASCWISKWTCWCGY